MKVFMLWLENQDSVTPKLFNSIFHEKVIMYELIFVSFQDPRFNNEVDKQTGYTTHSILCMPIKSPDGMVILLYLYDIQKVIFNETFG